MSQTALPPASPVGYGKAIVAGIVQPFAAAVAVLACAAVEAHVGHPLSSAVATALDTVIEMPLTVLAIVWTPHDLISKLQGG